MQPEQRETVFGRISMLELRLFLTFVHPVLRMKAQLAQMEERPGFRAPKGQTSLACAGLR
jgi:hypothetical protein